jgi:hypothetical protein
MGIYGDKNNNLLRYEDTIQLHFDQTGKTAWLTMKNYGVVFYQWPWADGSWNRVIEVTVGIPSTTDGKLPLDCDFRATLQKLGIKSGEFTEYLGTISIGEMLDATGVINFQVKMLIEAAGCYQIKIPEKKPEPYPPSGRPGFERHTLIPMIEEALVAISVPRPGKAYQATDRNFFNYTRWRLRSMLGAQQRPHHSGGGTPPRKEGPGALWIGNAIRTYRDLHLTGYFPQPVFIPQEQRTAFENPTSYGSLDSEDGKTQREDMRLIRRLPSPSDRLPRGDSKREAFSFEEFFNKLDEDRKANEDRFLGVTAPRKALLDKANFPNGVAYLHQHLDRVDCFGFRGDKRDPVEIHKKEGLLPGITRTDSGVARYKEAQAKLDALLKDYSDPRMYHAERYKEALKELDALTLGVFTVDQDFKAFISATTSTAIAKCFANLYAKKPNLFASTNCYALRCKGAFQLITDVPGQAGRDVCQGWSSKNDAKNAFTAFAEQEVTVAGRIGWEDVVGMRVVRVDERGQFFSGPVFLQDWLRSEYIQRVMDRGVSFLTLPAPDDGAFDELFELFSGKAQGSGPADARRIFWSYVEAPFNCPDAVWNQRGFLGGAARQLTG